MGWSVAAWSANSREAVVAKPIGWRLMQMSYRGRLFHSGREQVRSPRHKLIVAKTAKQITFWKAIFLIRRRWRPWTRQSNDTEQLPVSSFGH